MLNLRHSDAAKLADGLRCLSAKGPPKPCPYCGTEAVISLVTHASGVFVSIGCLVKACREYVTAQPTSSPVGDYAKLLDGWNTRPGQ